MQMHLHPTRREALTASDTALLTRWSLETNPATILAQMSTAPAPESLFSYMYSPQGHLHTLGGITGSPDGVLFAHEELKPYKPWDQDPRVIEWRNFDDFSLAHAITLPHTRGEVESLACSLDARWLVVESGERLFLLDWQTGEIVGRHAFRGSFLTSLIFDPTSLYVAGVLCGYECEVLLQLWRLVPSEHFVPRPPEEYWPTHEMIPQDEVFGSMALTPVNVDWGHLGMEWPNKHLEDAPGCVAFSPDSRTLLFSLHSTIGVGGFALAAFEVPSCKLLWSAQHEAQSAGQPIFSPGSSTILVPMEDGSILAYNAEDGALMQRLPTDLNEPIEALAFDHDGKTLWLATQEKLVQFQPQG